MTSPESPPRPTVHIPSPTYLYVIFDGPSGPESGRFVELEDENGQGVGGATWEERGDGLWSLGPFLQPPAETAGCAHCKEGWVCEAHPEKGWPHDACAGPGKPCTQCTQASYPTATEQPASDLGVRVEAILAEATFPEFRKADRMELSVKLSAIHGIAHRLKTVLAQYEEVLRAECEAVGLAGSMATLTNLLAHIRNNHAATLGAQGSHIRRVAKKRDDAEASLAQREVVMGDMGKALEALLKHVPPRAAAGGCDCDICRNGDIARTALAKYKEAHQPREASSTEGEQ